MELYSGVLQLKLVSKKSTYDSTFLLEASPEVENTHQLHPYINT